MKNYYHLFLILFLLSPVTHAEPENLAFVKQRLIQYHNSGQYMHEFKATTDLIRNYLTQRIAQNNRLATPKKLAIVLDIDETVLSNYKHILDENFGGDINIFNHEIEMSDDPALPPMKAIYQYAKQHRVAVFFVTGRREPQREGTVKNLLRVGFSDWNGLALKPVSDPHESNIPFKSSTRKDIEAHGYDIVATIGDQWSDIKGGAADQGFKLPNPFYYVP